MMASFLRILSLCALCAAFGTRAFAVQPSRLLPTRADRSMAARWLAQHFRAPESHRSALNAQAAFASLAINNLEISSDTGAGSYMQSHPAAVEFAPQRFMAFWVDEKNGVPDLRGRRFGADLSPLGPEFELFTDGLARWPARPKCATNGLVTALVWQNGEPYAIRMALVDSLGSVLLETTAGDVANPTLLGYPSVCALEGGRFIVIWEEYRSGWRIVGQLFDSVGAAIGPDLILDNTTDELPKVTPMAAADTSGGFCLTWSELNPFFGNVCVRCFDSLGSPRGPALKTPNISDVYYMLPQVAYVAATNRFFWVFINISPSWDATGLVRSILQTDGTMDSGSEVGLPAGPNPWQPAVSLSSGRVVVFTERFDNLGEIRSLGLDASGAVVESTSVISGAAVRERFSVAASSGSDSLFVVWQDRVSGDYDIHGLVRRAGATAVSERPLQSEGPGGQQTHADAAPRLGLGVLAVYADFQNDGNIAQVEVNEAGTLVSRQRVSDDTILAPQYDPHIASATSGWSFVTWTDERVDWPGAAVHAAGRFAQAGLFVGPSFPLSTGTSSLESQTDVAMRENKFSTAVWVDDRSGAPRAFMRRFSDIGTALGAEVPLSLFAPGLGSFEQDPAVAMDSAGTIWTAWTVFDADKDSFYVWMQAWTAGGVRHFTSFKPAVAPSAEPIDFDLAARGDGRARLVWYDAEAANPVVKTAVFDTVGATVEGPTDVSASPVTARHPRVAQDVTGRWVVAWSQSSALSDDILWQRFEANGTPSAPIEKISGTTLATRLAPALTYSGNFVYGAWHESSVAKGFDVRLSSVLKATSGVQDDDVRPLGFALHPVFPNPFNGATRISYTLDSPASVSLVVFDALGRRVRVLAHGDMWPGQHELTWDGTDDRGRALGSGVYFCRLQAGAEMETRKLLFLK